MNTSAEETRLRTDAIAGVRVKRPLLHRALDAGKVDVALGLAVDIASDLNQPKLQGLSPRSFYEIFLAVAEELRIFENFVVTASQPSNVSAVDLYERVQYTEQVTPRLYLLITMGSALVTTMQTPAQEVMSDLLNMCSAVQHPTRGLFLRMYLAQCMKDKLPDADVETANGEPVAEGSLQQTVQFLLRNFTEMNRLWVRMQHDCPPGLKKARRKERRELSYLVGSNIMTLSKLRGLDNGLYKEIVNCKESLAQEYLAECIVQVFPDEFHLETLEEFLTACATLQNGVDIRLVLGALTDRLSRFASLAEENRELVRRSHAFEKFRTYLPPVIETFAPFIATVEFLRTYSSLMKLVLSAFPDRLDYVDEILRFCVDTVYQYSRGELRPNLDSEEVTSLLEDEPPAAEVGPAVAMSRRGPRITRLDLMPNRSLRVDIIFAQKNAEADGDGPQPARDRSEPKRPEMILAEGSEEENVLLQMISIVFEAHSEVSERLQLDNFLPFMKVFSPSTRKKLSCMLLESVSEYKPCIEDRGTLDRLFAYLEPLLSNGSGEEETALVHPYLSQVALRCALDRDSTGRAFVHTKGSGERVSSELESPDGDLVRQDRVDAVRDKAESDDATKRLISKIVFLLDESDPARLYEFHRVCFDNFQVAGRKRLQLTLPSLIFASLRLACHWSNTMALEQTLEMMSCLTELFPELGARFYLDMARAAQTVGGRAVDVMSKHNVSEYSIQVALDVLEERVASSRAQLKMIPLMITALSHVGESLDGTVYNRLSDAIVSASRQLLTRGDRCCALCDCTHLFWRQGSLQDGHRVVKCLTYATESAEAVLSGLERSMLLSDIFIKRTVLYEQGCVQAGGPVMADLVDKVEQILEKQSPTNSKVKAARAKIARAKKYVTDRPEKFPTVGFQLAAATTA